MKLFNMADLIGYVLDNNSQKVYAYSFRNTPENLMSFIHQYGQTGTVQIADTNHNKLLEMNGDIVQVEECIAREFMVLVNAYNDGMYELVELDLEPVEDIYQSSW